MSHVEMSAVQDPIQNIVAHPEFNQLYIVDPVASGLSSSELKVMVDLIVENVPPNGYRAIEMCVNSTPMLQPRPVLRIYATSLTSVLLPASMTRLL